MASDRDVSYPRREPLPLPVYPLAGASRPPKPPLTKRMRRGHWIALDCVVGAAFALTIVLVVEHAPGQPSPGQPNAVRIHLVAALVIAAWIFVPVGFRRRAPVTAFGALVILAVLIAFANSSGAAFIFVAAAFVLYLVTTTSNRQTGAAALGLALVVVLLIVLFGRHLGPAGDGPGTFVPIAFALVIAWMTGYSVRQRRLYAQTIQEQATSSAVAEERLRIARELHDVVAHSMSVIAVQAGYGQYVIDSNPGDARDALGAIQATSRDALEEMRRMLGVLRQQDAAPGVAGAPGAADRSPDAAGTPAAPGEPVALGAPGPRPVTSAPLAPAPGLANLGRLIERTRSAGVEVSLECSGEPKAVPAGVDLSAYRIIQEALTNVVKHAGGGAHCVVRLDYDEDILDIRVTDDGGSLVLSPARPPGVPAIGAGHGIIGMRERALLCGGDFSAGALPDGGFEVTATLPLLGAAVAAPDGQP